MNTKQEGSKESWKGAREERAYTVTVGAPTPPAICSSMRK
jgi:hypothetical protein